MAAEQEQLYQLSTNQAVTWMGEPRPPIFSPDNAAAGRRSQPTGPELAQSTHKNAARLAAQVALFHRLKVGDAPGNV